MSSTDVIQINVRERPLSSDINDLQAILGRTISELANAGQSFTTITESGSQAFPANLVLFGLEALPSATPNVVVISEGVLLQHGSAIPPVAGPLDARDTRVAIHRVPPGPAFTVAAPIPGADTFYLLQARVSEVVVTNVNRDVFDPASGTFVAMNVPKQIERRVEFGWVAGTATTPPVGTTGWVPLAIVFRPNGGGAVSAAQIRDVRPLPRAIPGTAFGPAERSVEYRRSYVKTLSNIPGTNSLLLKLDMLVTDPEGNSLFVKSNSFVNANIFDVQTGLAFPGAANTVRYLYLAKGPHGGVRNRYAGCMHSGYVFVSDIPPTLDNVNSAAIPNTVLSASIPSGSAVCIGFLRSNGTGWYPMVQIGRHVSVWRDGPTSVSGAADARTILSTRVPPNAKTIDANLGITLTGGGSGALLVVPPTLAALTDNAFALFNINGTTTPEVNLRVTVPFPKNGSNQMCTIHLISATTSGGPSFEVIGWEF